MNIRTFIFTTDSVWDISRTIGAIDMMFDHGDINEGLYNEVSRKLQYYRIQPEIDLDDLVPDPLTGVYKHLTAWLDDFGVMDDTFDSDLDDITIETYPCTDSDFTMEGEECISDEDEQTFVIFSSFIRAMSRENDEELGLYEH